MKKRKQLLLWLATGALLSALSCPLAAANEKPQIASASNAERRQEENEAEVQTSLRLSKSAKASESQEDKFEIIRDLKLNIISPEEKTTTPGELSSSIRIFVFGSLGNCYNTTGTLQQFERQLEGMNVTICYLDILNQDSDTIIQEAKNAQIENTFLCEDQDAAYANMAKKLSGTSSFAMPYVLAVGENNETIFSNTFEGGTAAIFAHKVKQSIIEAYPEEEPELPTIKDEEGRTVIHASTVEELEDALLESNVRIVLEGKDYVSENGFYCESVENIVIQGTEGTRIISTSAVDVVLGFGQCQDILLEKLVVGHEILPTDGCDSGVISIGRSHVSINECDLFGCGLIGLSADDSVILANHTTIRDCSRTIMDIMGETTATFQNCIFTGNGYIKEPNDYAIECYGTPTINFLECEFRENQNPNFIGNSFSEANPTYTCENCTFSGNGWDTDNLIESITISPSSLTMRVGDTKQLEKTISPENADNLSVSWQSTNPEIATISQDGVVSAISEGTAEIYCTSQDAGKTESNHCNITVEKAESGSDEKPDDGKDPAQKPDDDLENKPGDDSENKPGDDSENKPDDDSENKPGDDSENKPGDDSENKPSDDSENKPSENPGNNDQTPGNDSDNNPNIPTVDEKGRTIIYAGTAEELQAALLKSNVRIVLEGKDYVSENGFYCKSVENIVIQGTEGTRIISTSGGDIVLDLDQCQDILLEKLVIGHDILPTDGCESGVISIGSSHVTINECDLFGCGLTGLSAGNSVILANHTIIRDCSWNIMDIWNDTTATFQNCIFTGNGYIKEPNDYAISCYGTPTINFLECEFRENQNPNFIGNSSSEANPTYTCENCTFTGNGWDSKDNPNKPTDSETKQVQTITITPAELTLKKGNNTTLSITLAPEDASNPSVTWFSTNPDIASVDKQGTVTALTKGTTEIYCVSADGGNVQSNHCKIHVTTSTSSSGSGGGGGGGGSSSGGGSGSKSSSSSSSSKSYTSTSRTANTTVPSYVVKGTWTQAEDGNWYFTDGAGTLYVNVWAAVQNPYANLLYGQQAFDWFRFDENGKMLVGWYYDFSDGFWYYLNPISDNTLGKMMTGWVIIDGYYYYFNPNSDGHRGRMYWNETTPDGYQVDENGRWIP